jgi:hypothetical protein
MPLIFGAPDALEHHSADLGDIAKRKNVLALQAQLVSETEFCGMTGQSAMSCTRSNKCNDSDFVAGTRVVRLDRVISN